MVPDVVYFAVYPERKFFMATLPPVSHPCTGCTVPSFEEEVRDGGAGVSRSTRVHPLV